MSTLYRFAEAAYWQRPDGGPLIVPIFTKTKTGAGKEKVFGIDYLNYLARINTIKGYTHIISPTYGPSRGLRANGKKIRMVMAVYPGPDNYVLIEEIVGNWGIVAGFPENRIPSMSYTHEDHPWLIHRVYGSNQKGTAARLKDEIMVPVMSSGRYIQMKWLTKG